MRLLAALRGCGRRGRCARGIWIIAQSPLARKQDTWELAENMAAALAYPVGREARVLHRIYGAQRIIRRAIAIVWSYMGELIFNLLVLTGAVKMSERVVREMFGL